jgi:ABC-type polysaccharide/polyol phosphate export permease
VILVFAISLFFRSSKNTLTTSLIVLLGLSIPAVFSTTLKNDVVSQIISHANPIDNIFSSLDNVLVDYQTSLLQNWQFIVPLIVFSLLAFILLIFAVYQFQRQGVIRSE